MIAVQRFAEAMTPELQSKMRGDFIGITGNQLAIQEQRRFIDEDLNRVWFNDRVEQIRSTPHASSAPPPASHETNEQREVLKVFDRALQNARGPVYFVDLHTTSSKSRPFVLIGDTLRNRRFARSFPIPIILGLEEQLDGAITEWANSQGCITVGFESGQHDNPAAIDLHEAGLWIAIVAAGLLKKEDVQRYQEFRALLAQASQDLPRFIEVRYRHGIANDEHFQMQPGFVNLQAIDENELLAHDEQSGAIRSQESGRILLPLYQGEGSDGFFLARDVKPVWLKISAILRRLRFDHLAPLLPGVTRHPTLPRTLTVNPHVARWYVFEIFHLLGYRKRRQEGEMLIVTRRKFDF